jgi:hypothetical protein
MVIKPEETGNYGVVEAGALSGGFAPVDRIVEKPKPGTTRSRLGVVGRYVLSPRIFHHLRTMPPGSGGEIQLTDGIARWSRGEGAGLRVRRAPLRLRQQARLPRGDGRLRPQAPRDRRGVLRVPADAREMTLNELRYLVAVAQEKSFGRAAAKCFVSQPALSVAIHKLEDELGAPLFERGKSEITVTPVGERIVEQAQRVLEEASRIRELAQAGRNQLAGPLKLGVIYTVAPVPDPRTSCRCSASSRRRCRSSSRRT